MARRRKIIWADTAKAEFKDVCSYWNNRNKSNAYSRKLRQLTKAATDDISNFSLAGSNSGFENIKFVLVREYQLFYKILEEQILILSFWDARQDPEKLKTRLE